MTAIMLVSTADYAYNEGIIISSLKSGFDCNI